jgi:hypothetical protein
MTGGTIVAIVIALASLFLALRGFRSHGLPFEMTALMAVVWLIIILVLVFVIGRIAG